MVLSIAGSDSGGGAGIQADLRVFSQLGTFATTAITAITAQNLDTVDDIYPVSIASIRAQIETVIKGFNVRAAKTGMLWSAPVVELVAAINRISNIPYWVIDPVMISTSGAALANNDAIRAYREALIPQATLVTPNLDEASVLLGVTKIEQPDMQQAALKLSEILNCAVLLKGGHLNGNPVDILAANDITASWTRYRILNVNTHGTGCMLSAAITAYLARDYELYDACAAALNFVANALANPWLLNDKLKLAGIEK